MTLPDDSFITGNGFAARCGWVLNYGNSEHNDAGRPDWCFCKTDRLRELFSRLPLQHEFVLVTHNSDLPVDAGLARYLDHPKLRAWFATNVAVDHPKLRPIPVGIANARWAHGDGGALRRAQVSSPPKTLHFDASYALHTNPAERGYCLAQTNIELSPARPFDAYLAQLASAYFCLSPSGNGIDCHRTWEALYLRTVPVVTRSALTEHHRDLPLVVLDDWAQFRSIDFSPQLYDSKMSGWTAGTLSMDAYLRRLEVA
jgi:hypothetical protein